jgi:N-acyl-D-amino-acid deacylase
MRAEWAIAGGTLIDPEARRSFEGTLLLSKGKIAAVLEGGIPFEAEEILDATGCLVSPGFMDLHAHDEDPEDSNTAERALLLQGVTTALAGNCGEGPLLASLRKSHPRHWLKVGYFTGHSQLRRLVGVTDNYRPATAAEIAEMSTLLRRELAEGSFGLSLGIEYVPGTSREELEALTRISSGPDRLIPIHIRHDGPKCLEAMDEALSLAEIPGARIQISHLGSMTAFGFTRESLAKVDRAIESGRDVGLDCYPYYAFCTFTGSAVFDPGFEERLGKGVEALEAASGPHKGQRLTRELFDRLRREDPDGILIAHVLDPEEVDLCLAHPRCIVGSDTLLVKGGGHPRAAGTFPKGLRMLREAGLSWPEALHRITSLPAARARLEGQAGSLLEGSPADITVFDPVRLRDRATFAEPLLPPEGIRAVFLDGHPVVREGEIADETPRGRLLTR